MSLGHHGRETLSADFRKVAGASRTTGALRAFPGRKTRWRVLCLQGARLTRVGSFGPVPAVRQAVPPLVAMLTRTPCDDQSFSVRLQAVERPTERRQVEGVNRELLK